ncbi:MAG: BTAD domain-containing putative transcriptional regulator [Syntrophotaleaceae bacterium]
MSNCPPSIGPEISVAKFNAFPFDPQRHLPRHELLGELHSGRWAKKRIILIAAKAGQGKTILTAQYAQSSGKNTFWYQVQPEDGDPAFLASAIYHGLQRCFQLPPSSVYEDILHRGEFNSLSGRDLADLLVLLIRQTIQEDFLIVFDDFHHLSSANQSLDFLTQIIKGLSMKGRVILNSRWAVAPLWEDLGLLKEAAVINDVDLHFSRCEIQMLFNDLHGIALSKQDIADLYQSTEGWAMGLQILSKSLRCANYKNYFTEVRDRDELVRFFSENLLEGLPGDVAEAFLQSSFLEDPSQHDIESLWGEQRLLSYFENWTRQGQFIESIRNDDCRIFRFHPLFHESLRHLAFGWMSKDSLSRVLSRMGDWFIEQGKPLAALKYHVQSEAWERIDDILESQGAQILAESLHATLRALLDDIPPNVKNEQPWIALFSGVAALESSPLEAYGNFSAARQKFTAMANPVGELFALSQIISFHLAIDGNFKNGSQSLTKAIELYNRMENELAPQAACQITNIIGSGLCFFDCDLPRAAEFIDLSLALAQKLQSKNFIAANRITRSYIKLFTGNWDACRREVEESFPLLTDPAVSPFYRLYLRFFQIDLLNMSGDFDNFGHQKTVFEHMFRGDLLAQGISAPFVLLCCIDIALAKGEFEAVESLLKQSLLQDLAGAGAHMRSQFLQYKALIEAMLGKSEESRASIEESSKLREEVGGRLHYTYNQIFAGAVFGLLGQWEKAKQYFRTAERHMRDLEEEVGTACVLMHRAGFNLNHGREAEGLQDLASGLEIMRRNRYEHFYGWNPVLMEKLLQTAIEKKIEIRYARYLAKERLGLAFELDGNPLPILKIDCLGGLSISVKDKSLHGRDFTLTQRKLIARLLTHQSASINIEEMQDVLWEEVSSESSRLRMDTALSRLRQLCKKSLDIDGKSYLMLNSGILSLNHCDIDLDRFRELSLVGLRHYKNQDYWQAGNALRRAYNLWQGPFMAETPVGAREQALRRDLLDQFLEVCTNLANVFLWSGNREEALTVIKKGLTEDSSCIPLARLLYDCYAKSGEIVKAARVLDGLKKALLEEEFLLDDLNEILESFWT